MIHQNKPLYSFNSMNSNAELFKSGRPQMDIKKILLSKQNNRCHSCSNIIMNNDTTNCKLKYINPINNGGENNISNLGLICKDCFNYI